jgi:hypothetical protein
VKCVCTHTTTSGCLKHALISSLTPRMY